MFLDSGPTRLDLCFRLFGFPVRVHPLFWLVMALLGDWVFQRYGVLFLLLWVACGFLSILIHELGHAFLIRRFGSPSAIYLYSFGGLATIPYPPRSAWKRLLIALAGPFAGFALLGVIVGSDLAFAWSELHPVASAAGNFLFAINLFWGVFNLLPIWPLDGGKVCMEVCILLRMRKAASVSYSISALVAGSLAAYAALSLLNQIPKEVLDVFPYRPGIFTLFFMGMLAYESWQLMQQSNRRQSWESEELSWERR